jgi:hypothetical protein
VTKEASVFEALFGEVEQLFVDRFIVVGTKTSQSPSVYASVGIAGGGTLVFGHHLVDTGGFGLTADLGDGGHGMVPPAKLVAVVNSFGALWAACEAAEAARVGVCDDLDTIVESVRSFVKEHVRSK